jgi:hypothetical protein
MRREEERWYRARLLGDYRTLGKARGEQLGNEWGVVIGLLAMVATGILVASGGSPFWYVMGCLSVPTLGVVVSAFALYFQFLPAQLLQACNHRRTQRSHILIITTRHQTTLHTTPHRFHQVQMRTITR